MIREAKAMGAEAVAVCVKLEIPQPILKIMPREEAIRYDLDTREMKYETAKMFNRIKYGWLY